MTEKRFTVHVKWFNYDKTEGEIILKDNGQPLLESECIEDVQRIKLLLNELNDENEQLKKENYELHKRLGDFEPYEDHIKEITSKTSVNDIIGLVKTDEPTDIVELKRSYQND